MNSQKSNDTLLESSNKSTSDDLRIGYQTAVQMSVYDGQLSWQVTGLFMQFAILMIAGAVFPSFVGSKDKLIISLAGLTVSFAGLIMTSMFGSMIMRIRTYEEYWVLCAKKLESKLCEQVTTFEGSSYLSSQGRITIDGNTVRLRRIAAIKSKLMLNTFFICFFVAFLGLFVINIRRFVLAI